MKEVIKEIKCDCCGTTLIEPAVYTNGGKYQKTYLQTDDHDLCFECAGKILDLFVVPITDRTTFNTWVAELPLKLDPLHPTFNLNIKEI